MLKLEEKIKALAENDGAVRDCYWLDNDTFVLYYDVSHDVLQDLFPKYIDDDEFVLLFSEYQEDKHKIVYILEFEDDSIDVSDMIQSIFLDCFILDVAQTF